MAPVVLGDLVSDLRKAVKATNPRNVAKPARLVMAKAVRVVKAKAVPGQSDRNRISKRI